MALGDAYQDSTDTALNVLAAQPFDPIVPDPKFSAWSVIPRAVVAAGTEVLGNLQDVAGAYGKSVAAYGAPTVHPFTGQDAAEKAQSQQAQEDLTPETMFRSPESENTYGFARYLQNDPITAGAAENIVFSVTKGLTKAITAGVALGPLAGAAAFGASEGITAAENLADQGVDQSTRTKVGAVTGVMSAAMMGVPVAGKTIPQTIGYALASGPASFIAQQAASSAILENANYAEIAQQYDPLDPVGLTIATLLPLGFGAWAMRGYRGAPKASNAADEPQVSKPGEVAAKPQEAAPVPTQEQMDAVMTHNLTIQRDIRDATPPAAYPVPDEGKPLTKSEQEAGMRSATDKSGSIKPVPKFDNASGDFNPDLDPNWIKHGKKEIQHDGIMSDAEYNTAIAEYANKWRVDSLLEQLGFKHRGSSNISSSKYFEKDVGVGEYDKEYKTYDEYKTYEVRVSDHADYHSSVGVEKRIQLNFRSEISDWADADVTPDMSTDDALGAIKNALPGDTLPSETTAPNRSGAPKDEGIDLNPPHPEEIIVEQPYGVKDPLIRSVLDRAESLKLENPEMPVAVREDGTHATAAQEIDAIRQQVQEGSDTQLGALDAKLFQVAVDCLLGG